MSKNPFPKDFLWGASTASHQVEGGTYNQWSEWETIHARRLADSQDINRQWWLEQTIAALRSALQQGVTLRGYLHWSLLDNFEWAYGWWPEFGLIHVDRTTMRRTIRPSARWFAKQIKRYRV